MYSQTQQLGPVLPSTEKERNNWQLLPKPRGPCLQHNMLRSQSSDGTYLGTSPKNKKQFRGRCLTLKCQRQAGQRKQSRVNCSLGERDVPLLSELALEVEGAGH